MSTRCHANNCELGRRAGLTESPHDKINKMECAPSEGSDQSGHSPSLIRVFTARKKKAWLPSQPLSVQRRFWPGWANAQADLSLRWAHIHFVGFVTWWRKCLFLNHSCRHDVLIKMIYHVYYFSAKAYVYSLEAPRRGFFNRYQQHMWSLRNKNTILIPSV